MTMIDIQAHARIDKYLINDTALVLKTAMHIAVDPIDGKKRLDLYTDDGKGNGDHLLSLDLD